ncbi:MAG: hypothetical protein E6572_13580 [Enterococcus faecalis]|uniref:CD3337/EF1877 family mobilome membrane protein n=1 Tax=Enterococcus faecalis TaxID=1351 RepID=UPI00066580A3|nr:MFS transporter [Enterococcus faecalis]MDU6310832.1 hypothetical protein [Enterococcus faecalis]
MKKILKLFLLFMIVIGLIIPITVAYAQPKIDEDIQVEKQKEVVGGVELRRSEYPLSHYEGVSNDDWANPILGAVMGISNSFFSFNKFLYDGFDYGVKLISSATILDDWVSDVGQVSKDIWEKQKNALLILVILIVGCVVAFQGIVQQNILKGMQTAFLFVVVFMLGSLFMTHGSTIIKEVNGVSNTLQASIAGVGTQITNRQDGIDPENVTEGVTTIIRNQLFESAVYRPYLIMNYGTTDVKKITKDNPDRIDELLSYRRNEDGAKAMKDYVVDKEIEKNEFIDKTGSGVYPKLGIALGSLILTIGIGLPILLIAFINMIIQILILGVFFILGISFFVSLFPPLRNSWIMPTTKMIGLIFTKALVSIFITFVLMLMKIIDGVIPPTSGGAYIVNSILLVALLWLMITKHREIVSMMTGGKVSLDTTGQDLTQGARSRMGQMRDRLMNYGKNQYKRYQYNQDAEKRDEKNRNMQQQNQSPNTHQPSDERGQVDQDERQQPIRDEQNNQQRQEQPMPQERSEERVRPQEEQQTQQEQGEESSQARRIYEQTGEPYSVDGEENGSSYRGIVQGEASETPEFSRYRDYYQETGDEQLEESQQRETMPTHQERLENQEQRSTEREKPQQEHTPHRQAEQSLSEKRESQETPEKRPQDRFNQSEYKTTNETGKDVRNENKDVRERDIHSEETDTRIKRERE